MKRSTFSIAGIQMRVSALNSNVEYMKYKVRTLMAIYPWVEMVVFSELSAYGPLTKFAQTFPCAAEKEFAKLCEEYNIWMVTGSIFEQEGEKIYNTATVINPYGKVIGRYRKMFPFLPYEQGVEGGEEFFVFDIPEVGRFGVSICYDMWFPETTRTLAAMGAEVILHPSLTGTIDRDIELSIARASAAVNQCYFFDINGVGDGGNGQSIVCSPNGTVIYQAGHNEEFIPIEIDLELVRRSREMGLLRLGQPLKSFRDRNVYFDIYEKDKKIPYFESLSAIQKPTRHFGKENS